MSDAKVHVEIDAADRARDAVMISDSNQVSASLHDGVLEVIINRPEKRNALSRAVLDELRRVFVEASENDTLRVATLAGAGELSFAAGGDLNELASVKGRTAAAEMAENAKSALAAIRRFPLPVIAALNGDALGGGAELAVACDMRVAASHARIGFIQGKLNISTAWGGGVDLMRLVGPARALQLLSSAEIVTAEAAQAIGLINSVAAPDERFAEAVDRFVAPFRRQAPQVLRAFKALSIAHRHLDREAADRMETDLFSGTWAHPDHDAAVERLMQRTRSP